MTELAQMASLSMRWFPLYFAMLLTGCSTLPDSGLLENANEDERFAVLQDLESNADPRHEREVSIWIEGAVRKPGKYRITVGKGLQGLLREEGLSAAGESITLVRGFSGGASRLYKFYPLEKVSKYFPRLVDGDVVVVSQKRHPDYTEINRNINPDSELQIEVAIQGKVTRPERYMLKEGDSLWELIEKAGGLTHEAWNFITITRGLMSDNKQSFTIDRRDKDREVDPRCSEMVISSMFQRYVTPRHQHPIREAIQVKIAATAVVEKPVAAGL